MQHYIKIFLSFALANYLYIYSYDNYYLVSVENNYLLESRDQLRHYALDLRSHLTKENFPSKKVVNQWSSENSIPTNYLSIESLDVDPEILTQLEKSDYSIDLYAEYGPSVYIRIDKETVVEVGPIDPLYIESTSLQLPFILLQLLINAILAFAFYQSYKRKSDFVENSLHNIINREFVSSQLVGEQNLLKRVSDSLIAVDSYISKLEKNNFQVTTDQRDLMHAVAHELRSPIARFSFALELLEGENRTSDEIKLIEDMHDSIDELESLIKEILSYSRLSHDEVRIEVEPVELITLFNTAISRLEVIYPKASFHLICDDQSLIIQADYRLVERAALNLLRNAARFCSHHINIEISLLEKEVFVAIEDDGIGIPPGKRERVFEAFTRLDPSRSRDSGGVGLGLAIVKKIIEKHQGRIRVVDGSLGGARFELFLPRQKDS